MRFWNVYAGATVVALLVIGATIYWNFFGPYKPSDSALQYASAQLVFTAVVIIAVVFSLLYATHQFRRSLARPDIELAVDETGNKGKGIALSKVKQLDIPIYAHNKGNRVATTYQIELKIPNVFEHYLFCEQNVGRLPGKQTDEPDRFAVSFYSYDQPEYMCFVGKPVLIGRVRLNVSDELKLPSQNLKIAYTIFGDWGEGREGSLELKIVKL